MEHTLSNLGLVNSLKDFEAKFIQQIIRAEVHLLSMFAAYVCIGVCVIVLFFPLVFSVLNITQEDINTAI